MDLKKPLTFEDQINKLEDHGLVSDYRRNKINDREEKFALLLYFGHHKKMILLQEIFKIL